MKLSETELQELAKQLRCPEGENGIKVGEMMNFTNSNVIVKSVESLNLQHNDTVLEIGPGNGSHVKDSIILSPQIKYHGIDISETMVTEAQKLNSSLDNVFFHLSDGNHIDFDANTFDKIFTTNTIYFWQYPQAYITEIARVLKPGGIVSIGFIPKSTMEKIPFAKFGFVLYDIETVNKLFEESGLAVLSTITEKEFVTSNSGEQIEREFVILSAKKL